MPDRPPAYHVHESYKAFQDADQFNNPISRTRAQWHVLMAIFHMLEEIRDELRCRNADR